MTIAQLDRPAPAATPRLRRVTRLRHTSPGRLQLILAGLLVLGLLTGLVTGLTAHTAATGTADLQNRAQPLLREAETIYSSLADADTTAAQAFLAGGLEPPALTQRYQADLDRATAALVRAARLSPESPVIADLNSGVARYAALVAAARANNRQNLLIGAAYLSTASTLNHDTLLAQARSLFVAAQADVTDGYSAARSPYWTSLLVVLLLALLIALLLAQRYLSRTTHRTFNVPLVGATALTVLLILGAGGLLIAQRGHLHAAETDGSRPIADLAEARTAAQRERSNEFLTLVARAGRGPYETSFDQIATDLGGPGGRLAAAEKAVDGVARDRVKAARGFHDRYVAIHRTVRQRDDGGDYDKAVELAVAQDTTDTFAGLTGNLEQAIENRKAVFEAQIGDAGRGLGALRLLGPVLAVLIGALAAAGLRARLEEYR